MILALREVGLIEVQIPPGPPDAFAQCHPTAPTAHHSRHARKPCHTYTRGAPSTMDHFTLIEKYTRTPVTRQQLATHATDPIAHTLAGLLLHAAAEVARCDDGLRATAATLQRTATRVTDTVNAPPGQPTAILNPLGELQNTGLQFDILIAQRDTAIAHLRTLAELWHLHQKPASTNLAGEPTA